MGNTMREFKPLHPKGLPPTYEVQIHGEEPIVTVEESEKLIIIHYTFPGFYLSDDSRSVKGNLLPFRQVTIAQTGYLGESGKPLLPSFGRYVRIPPDCDYTLTVEKSEPVEFDDILVLPAQEKLVDGPEKELFEFDREFYSQDRFYPEEIVEVSGPFTIGGNTALLLHVRPLQYNPGKKKVRGFSTVTVTIAFSKSFEVINREMTAEDNLFLNPERGASGTLTYSADETEFLIIYHEEFGEAVEKLAKWKNMRGLKTESVPVKEVGTTTAEIKAYLRSKKDSSLKYVLLFGDVDVIPPEKIFGGPSGNNITDYYYSTETDPERNELVFPWLSIGRIPVGTAKEALSVVEKIISYERDPPEGPNYYRRMVFASYFQDKRKKGKAETAYMETMEYIREHMMELGFSVERVYVTSNPDMKEYYSGIEVPEEVKKSVVDSGKATEKLISAASKGYLIVGHRDHGGHAGWVHPPFKTNHLDEVEGDVPSVMYSINCLTGRFDLKGPRDSFAEKMLKMKGGSPSLIAAARPSHTWLNDSLMMALFDAVWGGVLENYPGSAVSYPVRYSRLGDILNYGKAYLPVARSGDPINIKDHFEIYHVIGDPTLELWRANPLKMKMKVTRTQDYLDIVLSSCPMGNVITVWHKDEMFKRVEPSSTHVRVSLRGTALWPVPGEVRVCFWAPGYKVEEVAVE